MKQYQHIIIAAALIFVLWLLFRKKSAEQVTVSLYSPEFGTIPSVPGPSIPQQAPDGTWHDPGLTTDIANVQLYQN